MTVSVLCTTVVHKLQLLFTISRRRYNILGTLVIAIVLFARPKDHIVGIFHRAKFLQNHDHMNHMQIQNAILNERQFSNIKQ